MAGADRQLSWLQGDVLTDEAAKSLELQYPDSAEDTFVVVISHDCDLAAAADKEPLSEIIVGRGIERKGGDSYGKTARRLHIEYQTEGGTLVLELLAASKLAIRKSDLFATAPRKDLRLDGRD